MSNPIVIPAPPEGLPTLTDYEPPPLLSRGDYDRCADSMMESRRCIKVIVEAFTESRTAAHEAHRSITQLQAKLTAPFERHVDACKARLSAYDAAERAEREAERRRLEEQQKALLPEDRVVPIVPVSAPPQGMTRVKRFKAEITDLAAVPVEWLRPEAADPSNAQYAALQSRLNATSQRTYGKAQVPGVRFYQDDEYRAKPGSKP